MNITALQICISVPAVDIANSLPADREMYIHALFYRDAMQYWRSNYERQKNSAYNFRFLCPYYRSIDADIERDGKKFRRKFSMSDDFINNMISENKDNSFVAAMAYFYLFKGQILMTFDYRIVNSTVRDVSGKKMVYDMIDPHPGRMYYEAYNAYDGIMDFYDRDIPSQYLGGPSPLMFYPYSLHSTNWRFRTYMITGASYSVYIHEIFHNIESYYKIRPAHGYITQNQAIWPVWYRETVSREGVNAQLSYMRGWFEQAILPRGIDVIRLRETARTDIPENVYNAFDKKSSAVPFEKVRESGELFLRGQELYAKKDYAGAAALYRKASEINPCNQEALRHLAYTLFWNFKKKEESTALYQQYLDTFEGLPFTEEALTRVFWYTFWDKKDYPAMIVMTAKYEKWVHSIEPVTMLLFYRGVSLSRTGNYAAAVPLLEQALKNNIVLQDKISLELEICRKKLKEKM